MASSKLDMALDDIIKMNRKAGKKKLANKIKQAGNPPNQQRAQMGFRTSYKLRKQNTGTYKGKKGKIRGRNPNAGNKAQTLKQNAGQRRSQQSVREARARQAANKTELMNRRRRIEQLEPVPTTSKKALAPQGILQSDIVTYELEKKRKVATIKATAVANQPPASAVTYSKNAPRKKLDRSRFGGVAAATLQISLNNTNNITRRPRPGRVQVNSAVKGQVTQIQGQITKLQNRLSNIQKRQLFQIQAQGKASRRGNSSSIQRYTQRVASPKVTIKQRIGRANSKAAQASSRRKVIW